MINTHRPYSMFRRGLYTLLIGILLLSVLSFGFLGRGYSAILQRAIQTQSEDSAYILANNIELLLDNVLNATSALGGENAKITTMMLQQKKDPIANFLGYLEMKSLKTANLCASYVAVYNERLDLFYSTDALDAKSKAMLIDLVKTNFPSYSRSRCTLLQLSRRAGMKEQKKNALTFVYYDDLSKPNAIGALVVGVDCGYLQTCLKTRYNDDNVVIMLVDQDGRVISHPDANMICADFSHEPYVEAALQSEQDIDSTMLGINGENTMVTWRKSEYGWTYISLIPYSAISNRLTLWRNITILVMLGAVLLALLYAYFGARHMYKPIRGLLNQSDYAPETAKMNDIEYLSEQLSKYREYHENESRTREITFGLWLRGDSEGCDTAFCCEFLKSYFHYDACSLALLSIDRTETYRLLDADRRHEILQALGNYASGALQCPAYVIATTGNTIALIFSAANAESVADRLRAGLETFHAQFMLPCSAAYPAETSRIEALPALYERSIELMKEHYFVQNESVCVYTEKTLRSRNIQYDVKWDLSIWEAVRARNSDEIERYLEQALDVIRQCDFDSAKMYLRLLLSNIVAYFCAAKNDANADALYTEIRAVMELDTLELARQAILNMLATIARQCEALPSSDSADRITSTATKLTRENYNNPNFALNDVAEAMDLSPAYFNRVFKKATGKSYSAYLNSFRLTMLCSLLRSTNKPLSHLCTEVGIANENYCYTLFKKEYGMTPSQYRAQYMTNRDEDPGVPNA